LCLHFSVWVAWIVWRSYGIPRVGEFRSFSFFDYWKWGIGASRMDAYKRQASERIFEAREDMLNTLNVLKEDKQFNE